MKRTTYDIVAAALARHNTPPDLTARILADLARKPTTAPKAPRDAQWDALIGAAKAERRRLKSNLDKREPGHKPLHEAYIALLDRVVQDMQEAQLRGTPAQATAAAARINAERMASGKNSGATWGSTWQSWVPPNIRTRFEQEFDKAYGAVARKGGRFVPFAPPGMKKQDAQHVKSLRETFARIRGLMDPLKTGAAETPYRALWLCAVRQAELALDRWVKGCADGTVDRVSTPLPVNWAHLLDSAMRHRLREAAQQPALVSAEGLSGFLRFADESVIEEFNADDSQGSSQLQQELGEEP